jgi:hypothetical protein
LVQPVDLDEPGTGGRVPEGASKVPSGLDVIVAVLPTYGVTSRNRQPSEVDVVHDHIRLRQHQIVAITCIDIRLGARHVKHPGTTQRRETVGSSSGGRQLSSGGCSVEMISDGCAYANRKVSVKGINDHLLPTA